jgi:hypothetical protein
MFRLPKPVVSQLRCARQRNSGHHVRRHHPLLEQCAQPMHGLHAVRLRRSERRWRPVDPDALDGIRPQYLPHRLPVRSDHRARTLTLRQQRLQQCVLRPGANSRLPDRQLAARPNALPSGSIMRQAERRGSAPFDRPPHAATHRLRLRQRPPAPHGGRRPRRAASRRSHRR